MDIKKIVIDLSLGFLKDGLIGMLKAILEFVLLIAIGSFLILFSINHNKKLDDVKTGVISLRTGIDSVSVEISKLHKQIDSLKNVKTPY